MYKIKFLALVWLLLPMIAQGAGINNPMQPPAFALQKYRQAVNKNKPVVAAVKQSSIQPVALKLTSILYSSTRKIAIIDNKMLKVGDSVSGAKVISIKKDSARLVRQGKIINLSLSSHLKTIRIPTTGNKL